MDITPFASLRVQTLGSNRTVVVELDHGRANEMGKREVDEWGQLADRLADPEVRCLVTFSRRKTEKGTPVFIAGANVSERAGWSTEEVRAHVALQRATLHRLRRAPVFHVVVVEGAALGWGTEFLLTADYRIACPAAQFGLPETGLGIVPGAGGTSELWSLVGVGQALRLGMTGERIGADEALRIGLVQELATDVEAGVARAHALASLVGGRSPTAVSAFKSAVLAAVGLDGIRRVEAEARAYELCLESGEAQIGRENFKAITSGQPVTWGPKRLLKNVPPPKA